MVRQDNETKPLKQNVSPEPENYFESIESIDIKSCNKSKSVTKSTISYRTFKEYRTVTSGS